MSNYKKLKIPVITLLIIFSIIIILEIVSSVYVAVNNRNYCSREITDSTSASIALKEIEHNINEIMGSKYHLLFIDEKGIRQIEKDDNGTISLIFDNGYKINIQDIPLDNKQFILDLSDIVNRNTIPPLLNLIKGRLGQNIFALIFVISILLTIILIRHSKE